MLQISIINASSVIADDEAKHVVNALQTQVNRDFAPLWGLTARLVFVPKGKPVPANTWQLVILDNSDQAGALGYHDITAAGQPLGKIFANTDKMYGYTWSVTASHELLEMLVDPGINLTVFAQATNTSGILYAYEVCDACEDESFAYPINNVLVSDFVSPAWFDDWRKPGSARFDFGNHIKKPFELLKGGYIGAFNVNGTGGWKQITADADPTTMLMARAPVGSRRERRRIGAEAWITSKL